MVGKLRVVDIPGWDALLGNMVVNHLKFADDMCVQPQYWWAAMSSEYLW